MSYDYYSRKRKAVEDSVAEIHKARKAYVTQTERYNFTEKGLADLEFQIKKALADKLKEIRQNFINDAKNPVHEDLILYQSDKANKKSKMSVQEKILAELEFQHQVTLLQAKLNAVGDGALLIQDLEEMKDEDLYNVFKGMLIANTADENKSVIRNMKYIDEELAELQDHVNDFKMVDSDMSPMFGVNYGGRSFEEVVESEVFNRKLSDTFFKGDE